MSSPAKVLRRRGLSIRARLLLLVLAMVFPLTAIWVWYIGYEVEEARAQANARVKLIADGVAANIGSTLDNYESLLAQIATEFQGNPPKRARSFNPDQFIRMHPAALNFSVRDLHANSIYSHLSNPVPPDEARTFAWVEQGLTSESFAAGDAFLGRLSGRWVSVLTYPVHDQEGKRSGFVAVTLDLLALNQRLLRSLPKIAHVAVIDGQDRFLLRAVDPEAWIGKPVPAEQAQALRGRREGFLSMHGIEGVMRFYAVTSIARTGWRVIASLPEDEVLAPVDALRTRSVVTACVALTLLLALAHWLATGVARPIRSLAATAADIARGDVSARAAIAGPAEVAEVARELNHMLDVAQQARLALQSANEDLRASEERYRLLFDANPEPMWVCDADTLRFLAVNDATLRCYGYTREEFLAMALANIWLAEERPLVYAWIEARRQAKTRSGQWRHVKKNGAVIDVEIVSAAIEFDGRNARLVIAQDVTERVRAEHALHENLARFQALFDHSLDGVLLTRPDGRILKASPAACRMLGRTEQEIIAGASGAVFDAADPRLAQALQVRARSGAVRAELSAVRADGSKFPVDVTSVVFDTPAGQTTSTIMRDISERKAADDQIRQQLEELRRWYEVMLGREERVLELKREVNVLRERLGEAPLYGVEEAQAEILPPPAAARHSD